MGDQNKLDFVMTPDGELIPAEEAAARAAPAPEPKKVAAAEPKKVVAAEPKKVVAAEPKKVVPPFPRVEVPPFPPRPISKPPPLPPADEVEQRWGADRTDPVTHFADDLAVPPAAAAPRAVSDEALNSAQEVDDAIRDHKYRELVERVSTIDGDEDEPFELEEVVEEPRIIRGSAVAPPPSTKLSVTGSGPSDASASAPQGKKIVPRVLNRPIKERNRN